VTRPGGERQTEQGAGGLDGLVLVDKPRGITSHDAVAAVRRALGTKKVGHAGTLDPMATGLLVMGVGRATRLLRFLGELSKTYEGRMRLGVETDTLDAEGTVLRETPVDVDAGGVRQAMAELEGVSLQVPPAYSAVKVGGTKLYEAARAGRSLEAPARRIHVEAFDLIELRGDQVSFRVVCGGGTYVRVLVADVGLALGCGAHLTTLRRTAVGPFDVAVATAPDAPILEPPERIVAHLPKVPLSEDEATAAGHGRPLGATGIDGPYATYAPDGRLVGVFQDDGAKGRPIVVLQAGGV
jgi:tRNA pseudouridine55 synthase